MQCFHLELPSWALNAWVGRETKLKAVFLHSHKITDHLIGISYAIDIERLRSIIYGYASQYFITRVIYESKPLGPYHSIVVDNADHGTAWRLVLLQSS